MIVQSRTGESVQIDDADLELWQRFNWSIMNHGKRKYVAFRTASGTIYFHREVLGLHPCGKDAQSVVDHINRDGLDNRRSNLRVVSRSHNGANSISSRGTSRFKGVSWNASMRKWQAHIMKNGKSIYLGLFTSEVDAARAYDSAAKKAFGEFARTNA